MLHRNTHTQLKKGNNHAEKTYASTEKWFLLNILGTHAGERYYFNKEYWGPESEVWVISKVSECKALPKPIMLHWKTYKTGVLWEYWVFVRKLQEKKTQIFWPQFLQSTELFLECVFMVLPGGVDSSELTPAMASHMPLWKNMFSHTSLSLWLLLYSGNSS